MDVPDLARRARRGDQTALATLLRHHERQLYSSALAILRSSWDAQDAVQETFLEACVSISSLRDCERFAGWISTILTRKCLRILRASSGASPLEYDVPGEGDVFIGTERDEQLLRAVAELPEEQRTVIALRFYLDLSYREIQQITGWPEGTVKSRINRATRGLRMAAGRWSSMT